MKKIKVFLLCSFLWISLSATDCTSPPSLPILYSVEVVLTLDGNPVIDYTSKNETSARLEIKGRNFNLNSSSVEVCMENNCLTVNKINTSFPAIIEVSNINQPGQYKVIIVKSDSEYNKRSNPCYINIY